MSEQALTEAYATLKLPMDADLAAVDAAYQQHAELFSNNSMACYALCNEAEQQLSLKAVENAHLLILRERFATSAPPEPVKVEAVETEGVKAEADKTDVVKTDMADKTDMAEPSHVRERSMDVATPAEGDSLGAFLKQQRQRLGVSLVEISEKTKVSRTILGHIEQESYPELPAPVYLRGFIIEFAKIVQVADPQQIASQYLQQMRQEDMG